MLEWHVRISQQLAQMADDKYNVVIKTSTPRIQIGFFYMLTVWEGNFTELKLE